MKTLYDLLGALPDDNAESLRAAFRKAAKANHPDRNPDDPDAPQRFRRILHANAILRDERQRATYDQLLEIALRQQGLMPRRGIFSDRARRAALDTVTGAALSVGLFGGGYLLLAPAPKVPLVPPPMVELSTPEAAHTARDTVGRVGSRDKPDDVAAPNRLPTPETLEATTPATTPPSGNDAPSPNVQPLDFGPKDAKYYHERGISAYRSGDLYLALVDFDLAISLDPNAQDAYIDRAIIYHRMGDLNRAFADVSKAKRIDDSNKGKAASARVGEP